MVKRILALFLTAVVCILAVPQTKASALVFTPNCVVSSQAVVLYNMDVGSIVYEKNADMKLMPAALAQVMTAVIVLEECPNISSEIITVQPGDYSALEGYEHESDLRYANIQGGDELTVEDLLYAMMLTSSCEASLLLSKHFGGEDAFVEKMNSKAAALGLDKTRFTNSTGLYSARQLTSAHDMMKLLQYAMNVPQFEAISCATSYTPPTASVKGKTEAWAWTHSVTMSNEQDTYYCQGVKGIKTGNLEECGRNICCKASRDGSNYLLVCLNAPLKDEEEKSHFYHLEDAKKIIDWAFAHLTYKDLLSKTEEIGEVKVANAKDNDFVIVKPAENFSCIWADSTSTNSLQKIKTLNENVKAPVKAGDKLGSIQLKYAGEILADIDLVASGDVERSFWKYNLSLIPSYFRSGFLGKSIKIAIVVSVLYLGLCIFFFVRYRQQRKRRREARQAKQQ